MVYLGLSGFTLFYLNTIEKLLEYIFSKKKNSVLFELIFGIQIKSR